MIEVVSTEREAHESDLVDVSRVSLSDLRGLEDSALARALRRVLDEVDRTQGAVAGWQSAI
jgi:FXSXX-COOH protein